jgi:NADH-quinone oxidoreductase subunit G
MTRCIHCTRCIRFGDEVVGLRELGATGRGEHMEIGTYVKHSLKSEMSGNVIDLCPVGALTSKPFRYKARAWEITQHETVAPHDCIGSNILTHVFRNEVVRVVPRENEAINETWLSDRDRFSYEALNSEQRLSVPMLKVDGQWRETDWNTALERVVTGIQAVVRDKGAGALGAIASPSSTTEELYLLQKLLRSLGSDHIDHRLLQSDFSDQDGAPAFPSLGMAIADLERQNAILLVGSNIRQDQPIAGHRLRKAAMHGAAISAINPLDYDFNFPLQDKLISAPAGMAQHLAAVLKALAADGAPVPGVETVLAQVQVGDAHRRIAQQLRQGAKSCLLLGHDAHAHAHAATLRALAQRIAQASGATLGFLTEGGNSAGAWLAGALPHRGPAGAKTSGQGKALDAMLADGLGAYILLGVEPEHDCAQSRQALAALRRAGFVVTLAQYDNAAAREYADVMLPVCPFTETSGTFVNAEGRWQSFEGVCAPRGEARPAWKVLRVLGNLFGAAGFDYIHSREIRDELRAMTTGLALDNTQRSTAAVSLPEAPGALQLIAERNMYAGDAIQRRAASLACVVAEAPAVRMNAATARQHGVGAEDLLRVTNGTVEAKLPVCLDARVPDGCAAVPAAVFGAEIGHRDRNVVSVSKA